jgi:hypothetical protein
MGAASGDSDLGFRFLLGIISSSGQTSRIAMKPPDNAIIIGQRKDWHAVDASGKTILYRAR